MNQIPAANIADLMSFHRSLLSLERQPVTVKTYKIL